MLPSFPGSAWERGGRGVLGGDERAVSVFRHEFAVFVLVRLLPVMLLLPGDVGLDRLDTGLANRKRAIAVLPIERREFRAFGFDPFGRALLEFFDDIRDGLSASQAKQDVDMICGAVTGAHRRLEVSQDAGVVLSQFRFDFGANQWFAVLGAKDEMHIDGREGLRHGVRSEGISTPMGSDVVVQGNALGTRRARRAWYSPCPSYPANRDRQRDFDPNGVGCHSPGQRPGNAA